MGCDIHTIVQVKKDDSWKYVPELPEEFRFRNYSLFALLANVRNYFNTKGFEPKGLPDDLGDMKFGWKSEKENHKHFYETATSTRVRMPDGSIKYKSDDSFKVPVTKKQYEEFNGTKGCDGVGYYIYNYTMFGGKEEEIPYTEIYKTFQDYLYECWGDEYDKELDDYGDWEVDFSCEDYHSHSYLTLKELEDFDKTDYKSTKVKVLKCFMDKFFELGGKLPDGMQVEDCVPNDIISAIREAIEPMVIVKWQTKEDKENPLNDAIQALKDIADKYGVTSDNIRIVFAFDN